MSFASLKFDNVGFVHQDLKPIIFVKEDKKNSYVPNQPGHKQFKQLDSDEPEAPKVVGLSVGKQIQTARTQKKMSQKDLAMKINVKPNVIQEYESGKAIPDSKVIRKISQILGIKIV